MASDVFLEDIISHECPKADAAGVGGVFGVRESVSSDMFFSDEALATAFMRTVVLADQCCMLLVHLCGLPF